MAEDLDLYALAVDFVQAYHPIGDDPLALVSLLQGCPLRTLAEGDVLFEQGAPPEAMFFLLQGRVRVNRLDSPGASHRIASLQAPAVVGHMSLVDAAPENATCVARAPSIVATLPAEAFTELLASPGPRGSAMRHLLLAAMSDQLAGANGRIRALIDPATITELDDETTGHGIVAAGQVLEGWYGPGSDEDTAE